MLESLLYSSDYALEFAADGAEALAKTAALRPDLILLDVMMPGMDGFEVCRRIRANADLSDIPILLVTALDDRQSKLKGIEAGADDFVTKPIDRAEMRARVKTITRLNRYRRIVEERERFAWVVEQAEDGFLLIDSEDGILYANATARRMLNLSDATDLSELKYLQLARRQYRCEPEINWKGWPLRQGADLSELPEGASPDTLFLIRPETSLSAASWLQVSALRQPGSMPPVQLVRMHDVTSEMINRRDMFAFHSLVMHKLNTPLHLMLASMEMLRSDVDSNLYDPQTTELVELAMNGAFRLRSVVGDILRFVSVPALSDFSQHFMLRRLRELINQVTDTLKLKSVEVQTSLSKNARLIWSERVVEIVLAELLRNSQKFHPRNTPKIQINVTTLDADTPLKRLLIQVVDDGANLTPEQLAHVWTPYYQAERYFTGEVPGMGLGLSIVSSLVWEVNGTCRMYNRTGGPGVVVELTLPLLEDPPKSSE